MTIHPKIHRGHLPVAAIGKMAAILLHELNRARGIEAEAAVIDGICRNVTPATGRSRNSPRKENSYLTGTVRTVVPVVPNAPPQRACHRYPARNTTVLCAPIRPARRGRCWQPRKRPSRVPCATGGNKRRRG